MFNQLLLGLFLGFFLGTYFGALLMAVMAMAKRFDPVEMESERRGGSTCMDISIPNLGVQ